MVAARHVPGDDGCPCGSGEPYGACCGPYIDDGLPATTAEAVMRSRYTSYVLHHEEHLLRTWHPATRPSRVAFDPTLVWEGLAVRRCVGGQPGDPEGVVEFRARWRREVPPGAPPGAPPVPPGPLAGGVLRERSVFWRRGGRWLYLHAADDAPGAGVGDAPGA